MLNALIGVLVVIAVIYLAIIIYQRFLLKRGRQIEQDLHQLRSKDLPKQFEEVESLGLTGDSLSSVNSAHLDYVNVSDNLVANLNKELKALKESSKGLNVVKTRSSYQAAEKDIHVITDDINDIIAFLNKIKKMNEEHKQAVSDLTNRYQTVRKTLLSNQDSFGPAFKGLQAKLSSIEETFYDFQTLTNNGDQERAEKILVDLNAATDELVHQVNVIPKLFAINSVQFKKQLGEINSSYNQMEQAGYRFTDSNIDSEISELEDSIKNNLNNIADLDLQLTEDSDNEIEAKISNLYDELEKEMKARREVEKRFGTCGQFISHARRQNQALMSELKHLSLNYSLEHGEIETCEQLGKKIEELSQLHQTDADAMSDRGAVYSEILVRIKQANDELTEIETKQRGIHESVADFSAEEEHAHETLNNLDLEMHGLQRKIDDLNLPGISRDYSDYYAMVSDEINDLNHTMNQVKVSMDQVNEKLATISHDRDLLLEKTNELIDSSNLAEQVMQYANRLATTNSEVAYALDSAKRLFEQDCNYKESLDTIASAVDKAEPGAYKRIENTYYKSKEALSQEEIQPNQD